MLSPDRLFDPEPARRKLARQLYESVAGLPIVSPHGHVDPRLFADPHAAFGSPADLFIIPDHYVTRMLHNEAVQVGPPDDQFMVEAAERPLNRCAQPIEIAQSVLYLSSDAASFITGAILAVDGGGTV